METEKEIWKPVVGFECLYEVSSFGRIKSLFNNRCKFLKQTPDRVGYMTVTLCKNGTRKNLKVHRLVALSFLPIHEKSKNEINHKNEIKSDNHVENLEWCTHYYNMKYGGIQNKITLAKSKKVMQFNIDGSFIKEWSSTREIERTLGFKHGHISACCLGKICKSYGYLWRYKE